MAENSKIEWCDHTFNPWLGCTRVGPGCDNCYASTATPVRVQGIEWGPGKPRQRTSEANWKKPLQWDRKAREEGKRYRVFCASLADVFDNEVSIRWQDDLFDLICRTDHLDWLLLTKRIGNVDGVLTRLGRSSLPSNVWLGITVVNQEEADRDILKLLKVPVEIRFLSIEPLLGAIDLERSPISTNKAMNYLTGEILEPGRTLSWTGRASIDWVIAGGESGPNARPAHPDWFRSLRDQCAAAGVPFFMKQMGGKRDKKGKLSDLPEDLRIRGIPND